MPKNATEAVVPTVFAAALESLKTADLRSELSVQEIPAPANLAPHSFALAADVIPARHGEDSELATGRLVLLYDPTEPDVWGGRFRIVCFAQAPLETDIGIDPFLADVAWSWLLDALATRECAYASASGTATKILSTGYGGLEDQGDGAQIEIRASWTPTDGDIGAHVEAWGDLLCMLAGLPPTPEGVALLSARRSTS